MNDPFTVAIAIGCLLLVTFGGGRVVYEFTNERVMKWLWIGVMLFFAVCMAVGMWGYGQNIELMWKLFRGSQGA